MSIIHISNIRSPHLIKVLFTRVGIFLLCLVPHTSVSQEKLKVDTSIILECAKSQSPLTCIGDASNKCQGFHDDGFDGGTTKGITICINHERNIWEQLVSKHEEKFSRYYGELDRSSFKQTISRAESFEQTQKSWRDYRNAQCRFQYSLRQEGTIRSIAFADCMLSITARRLLFLRDLQKED